MDLLMNSLSLHTRESMAPATLVLVPRYTGLPSTSCTTLARRRHL